MNENEYSIVIVMCLSLFLIYMINNMNNKLSKLKNNYNGNNDNYNNDIVFEDNIDYKIKEVDNEKNIFNEMIKYNHSMCPIMDSYSKISACIHYPPLNRGFIVSTCCKYCIRLSRIFNDVLIILKV